VQGNQWVRVGVNLAHAVLMYVRIILLGRVEGVTMIKRVTLFLAAGCLCLLAMHAQAGLIMDPITYALHFDDGSGNTLDGRITTDGTIGSLSDSNFLSWSWKAKGAPTFDIAGPCVTVAPFTCVIRQASWRAEPVGLYFNFSNLGITPGTSVVSVFDVTGGVGRVNFVRDCGAGCGSSVTWSSGARLNFATASALLSGDQLVGTPIPEPTTLALLSLGLAGIGYSRKRKAA
jgi:hypothetical protein